MITAIRKVILMSLLVTTQSFPMHVTYRSTRGRFGDNLINYLHAKWLSFKYNLDFIYDPFIYSDNLELHNLETKAAPPYAQMILTAETIRQLPCADKSNKIICVVPYFSEVLSEHLLPQHKNWIYYPVDWDNSEFKNHIKRLVTPKDKSLLNISLPQRIISVAIHIRMGGGYDQLSAFKDDPLKFPPLSYYISQLKAISEQFENKLIYAFIFTDDKDPLSILNQIKNELHNYENIQLACRKNANTHDRNVLEDFFAMSKYNCLIRPQSSFSIAASKIADYTIEIAPTKYSIESDVVYIKEVEIKTTDKKTFIEI